jgi:osmoprotectant transport system permease protein
MLAALAGFIVLISNTGWWETTLRFLFPNESSVIHPRASLLVLVWEHVQLVGISSGITMIIGIPLGIWVTRPGGRDFLPIVTDITSFGQTFPPVAVLALAVPVLGFGLVPTVVALFLYGLLPVVRNTIAGLNSVPLHLLDAAYGMGMGRIRTLFKVELPLAAQVILAGVRISVIINIGTAMIGAVIGAGGLGSPIIAGLVQNNLAFIIEGALPAAMLAILADQFLGNIEILFSYSGNSS